MYGVVVLYDVVEGTGKRIRGHYRHAARGNLFNHRHAVRVGHKHIVVAHLFVFVQVGINHAGMRIYYGVVVHIEYCSRAREVVIIEVIDIIARGHEGKLRALKDAFVGGVAPHILRDNLAGCALYRDIGYAVAFGYLLEDGEVGVKFHSRVGKRQRQGDIEIGFDAVNECPDREGIYIELGAYREVGPAVYHKRIDNHPARAGVGGVPVYQPGGTLYHPRNLLILDIGYRPAVNNKVLEMVAVIGCELYRDTVVMVYRTRDYHGRARLGIVVYLNLGDVAPARGAHRDIVGLNLVVYGHGYRTRSLGYPVIIMPVAGVVQGKRVYAVNYGVHDAAHRAHRHGYILNLVAVYGHEVNGYAVFIPEARVDIPSLVGGYGGHLQGVGTRPCRGLGEVSGLACPALVHHDTGYAVLHIIQHLEGFHKPSVEGHVVGYPLGIHRKRLVGLDVKQGYLVLRAGVVKCRPSGVGKKGGVRRAVNEYGVQFVARVDVNDNRAVGIPRHRGVARDHCGAAVEEGYRHKVVMDREAYMPSGLPFDDMLGGILGIGVGDILLRIIYCEVIYFITIRIIVRCRGKLDNGIVGNRYVVLVEAHNNAVGGLDGQDGACHAGLPEQDVVARVNCQLPDVGVNLAVAKVCRKRHPVRGYRVNRRDTDIVGKAARIIVVP